MATVLVMRARQMMQLQVVITRNARRSSRTRTKTRLRMRTMMFEQRGGESSWRYNSGDEQQLNAQRVAMHFAAQGAARRRIRPRRAASRREHQTSDFEQQTEDAPSSYGSLRGLRGESLT